MIFSAFLGKIKQAFELDPNLKNLLLDPFFKDAVHNSQTAWRKVVASSAMLGIPTPAFSTALAFYDSYRSDRLPANLLQVRYMSIFIVMYVYTYRHLCFCFNRHSVIISVLIHMNYYLLLVNIYTQTGLVLEVMCLLVHTKLRCNMIQ